MLLVMNTTGLFDGDQPLTVITKDRMHSFLPGLWEEVFKMSTPPLSAPTTNNEVGHILPKDLIIEIFLTIDSCQTSHYC
jgi:hypothetical protein